MKIKTIITSILCAFVIALSNAADGPLFPVDTAAGNHVYELTTVTSTVTNLFNNHPPGRKVVYRAMQNVGTNACLFSIATNSLAAGTNSFALAGGSANWDGLGSLIDLSMLATNVIVYVRATNTTQIITLEISQ